MTNIEIVFNSVSFSEIYTEKSLRLESSFQFNDPIQIFSQVQNIQFNNRNELIALFEIIRGADMNSLQRAFFSNNYTHWANANFYEQQAFKSLVLIYHWLELSIANPADLDIKKNFYNEFIVDWNFIPGVQNTIYLIAENNIKDIVKIKLLDKLQKINLLCKITINTQSDSFTNYFIPLLTPGVPIEYFKSEIDLNGTNANKLWKELLRERDIRIKNWVNNRF